MFKDYFSQDEFNPGSTVKTQTLSADEQQEYASIMTPIDTYAKEQAVKFITGARSFDDWDKYVSELKAMGDIQKAMDIYNTKIVK